MTPSPCLLLPTKSRQVATFQVSARLARLAIACLSVPSSPSLHCQPKPHLDTPCKHLYSPAATIKCPSDLYSPCLRIQPTPYQFPTNLSLTALANQAMSVRSGTFLACGNSPNPSTPNHYPPHQAFPARTFPTLLLLSRTVHNSPHLQRLNATSRAVPFLACKYVP